MQKEAVQQINKFLFKKQSICSYLKEKSSENFWCDYISNFWCDYIIIIILDTEDQEFSGLSTAPSKIPIKKSAQGTGIKILPKKMFQRPLISFMQVKASNTCKE